MKRKDKIVLYNVEIESVAAEGNALARVDGKVLFVPQCIPGDVVDVRLTRKRSGYMEGVVVNMVKPSPLRVEPFCKHYGVCGGCKWQALPYELQLKYKQQQVVDQLTRIGHLQLPEITPILGSEEIENYRNKLEFTFSNRRWLLTGEDPEALSDTERLGLGFHISGFFDKVLDIRECHLQAEPSNAIRNFVREYAIEHGLSFFDLREQVGFLRNMVVRTTILRRNPTCSRRSKKLSPCSIAYSRTKLRMAFDGSACRWHSRMSSTLSKKPLIWKPSPRRSVSLKASGSSPVRSHLRLENVNSSLLR